MRDLSRRGFLSGLGSLVVAPAIVPFASLMPVRGIVQDRPLNWADLISITRKAFLPRLHVQLYQEMPSFMHLLEDDLPLN